MLKALRKRLTWICVTVTGVLLIAMTISVLWISEAQTDRQSGITFQNNVNSLVYKIQSGRVVDNAWLAQLENGNRLIVHLEDNRIPILFPGSWTPKTDRDALIEKAQRKAFDDYGLDVDAKPASVIDVKSERFEITGDHGDRYQASVSLIPSEHGWQSLTLLRDIQAERGQKLLLRLSFLSIVTAALLLLYAFSWWFSGRAIVPIEENMKKQTEFAAAASHELRSPLAVVRACVSALSKSTDPEEQARFIRTSDQECARMARLIDDLLFLTRSDTGSWSLEFSHVELDTLLTQLYDSFLPIVREKGQTLSLELPEEALPEVSGDPGRLSQAVSVLLDNASSYTPENGTIRLSVRKADSSLVVSVSDSGPGISEDQKKRVFDRFYRADPSRSKKEHYGLGLSIAKEIVELHHGQLSVTDAPEGGAQFLLCLPISL